MKRICLIIAIFGLMRPVQAQQNQDKAKAYYFSAENEYKARNFENAINFCNEVVTLLGKSNPRVEALLLRSYFDSGDTENAKKSLDKFLSLGADEALLRTISPYIIKIEGAEKERLRKEKEIEDARIAAEEKDRLQKQRALEAAAARERARKEEERLKTKTLLDQGIKPDKYRHLGEFTPDGLAVIQSANTGKYGYIDKNANEVVAPEFDKAEDFEKGAAKVARNNKWGLVSRSGQMLTPVKYDEIKFFYGGFAPVSIDKKWGFIKNDGTEITPTAFDAVDGFRDGFATVNIGGKWGLIDQTGKRLTPIKYEAIYRFYEGRALVKLDAKFGYIDTLGKEIIPAHYEDAEPFNGKLAKVKLNGKWTFITKDGKAL